jgi:hypothetical protein
VSAVEGIGLMLRRCDGVGLRAVLVVDDGLLAWWEARVAADPERARALLLTQLAHAAADARDTERYVLLDGARFTPSLRTRLPPVRDRAEPPTTGRWVAYLPVERDEG